MTLLPMRRKFDFDIHDFHIGAVNINSNDYELDVRLVNGSFKYIGNIFKYIGNIKIWPQMFVKSLYKLHFPNHLNLYNYQKKKLKYVLNCRWNFFAKCHWLQFFKIKIVQLVSVLGQLKKMINCGNFSHFFRKPNA